MSKDCMEKLSKVNSEWLVAYGIYVRYCMQGSLLWSGTFNEEPKVPKWSLIFWRKHNSRQSKQWAQRPQSESVNNVVEKKKRKQKECFNMAEDSEWGEANGDKTRKFTGGKAWRAS